MLVPFSCSNETEKKTIVGSSQNEKKESTVAKAHITNELAGSAYRKRADSYFIVTGSDTSSFKPVFSEAIETGLVSLNLNLPYSKATVSYEKRLFQLKQILERVKQDYQLDSLTSVSYGRLILSGDLAIEMTKEYEERFGQTEQVSTKQYKQISQFLLTSILSKDLNRLLKPYHRSVKRIGIEKVFFTTKNELLSYSYVEQDTSLLPPRIIDFMTWIELGNE